MKKNLIFNIMLLLMGIFAYLPNVAWADSLEVAYTSLDDAMMQFVTSGTNQTKNNGTCTYQWTGVHSDSVCRNIWNKTRQLVYFPITGSAG